MVAEKSSQILDNTDVKQKFDLYKNDL